MPHFKKDFDPGTVWDSWSSNQHLWWKYYHENQDHFYDMSDWPPWAKQAIMKWHKNDSEMYNLMYFFIGNGLSPVRAFNWVMAGDVYVKDGVWTLRLGKQYSAKEIVAAERVMKKAEMGELLTGKKDVYDMVVRRVVKM